MSSETMASTTRATGRTPRTPVQDVLDGKHAVGDRVTVKGWVRTRRDSKAGMSFIHLHDGSGFHPIQVVAPNDLPNYEEEVLRVTSGASIVATGEIVESPGKGQSVEIRAQEIEVVGLVDDPETYPVQPKRHSFEFLREVAHLRPRTNTFGAITRVRHTLANAVHRFFDEHGFYWIHTPIITTSDAEGAGEMFRVSTLDMANLPRSEGGDVDFSEDFFGREAHLTVSGQLNVEAYCLALSNVYTFGPTFRAENSHTSRHLAEFWMIEPEIAFADLQDDADLAEDFLKSIFRTLLDERPDDMAFFDERIHKGAVARLEQFVEASFERMGLRGGGGAAPALGQAVRVPCGVGDRPAVRARAVADRGARRPAGGGDELPEGDQGFLHARQRRRTDGCGDGRAGARHRRDHRWVPARGAPGRARRPHPRGRPRPRVVRLGTATSAVTARCPTPASASASSAPSSTRPAWPTSET
jgi:aspartyl/asparaginyl-tRNA synthetase